MTGTDIQQAKAFLEAGELVAIPTETVYGLAGNALDPAAVLSIFRVKNRPAFDPLIVHTNAFERLWEFVREIPEKALVLAEHLTPGPITFLLPKAESVPDLVTSGLDTVAVRIPRHEVSLSLLSQLAFPLAAPSANPFGYISPTTAQHVEQQLGKQIAYILDGGACEVGVESTIVGFEGDQVIVYRKGGTPIERIEQLVGPVEVRAHSSSNPQAPGMLKSHYAPRTPLTLMNDFVSVPHSDRIGVLSFQNDYGRLHQEILSITGDFAEAAHNLFAAMRRLDALGLDRIYAELVPERDLGTAINDRIRRAAAE
ncbi:L-threonylcarbamoyladenylate synthase [Siphonobacter sp.]|uniref:L-threonylcarbamoyladenylate synthase n=1 Tax=Siphonobacter sp. TaxID=1869184 RepID=UPI003B3B0493